MRSKLSKAIFPVAGLGTRFLPATKSIPKEIMTLVDRPLIQYAIDEARAAGITEFIFVTSRGKGALEDYFDHAPVLERELRKRDKQELLDVLNHTNMDSGEIAYVRQHQPLGLGHAVWCARRLIADEPFAVILPDDVIAAKNPCLKQMVDAFEHGWQYHCRNGGTSRPDLPVWHSGCRPGQRSHECRKGHGRKTRNRHSAIQFSRYRPLYSHPKHSPKS